MNTAPTTTRANATSSVTTRTGTDTSHHLASTRRARRTRFGPAMVVPGRRPDACYGPDLLGNAPLSATARGLHDQIVIVDGASAGTVSWTGGAAITKRNWPATKSYRMRPR